jgi:solute carrier family 35 protein F1/2
VALLALVDVEANVLVTKAYQYTSLTSVTLLDCFTIPVVTLLSWLLLRARYRPGHYAGAAACIAGLALLVLGDAQPGAQGSSTSSGSAPLLGDALVLAGAALYAVCNVAQELLLSEAGLAPGQLLALLGVFGAVVSGLQAAALEHSALAGVCWSCPAVLLPLGGFAGAMLVFYSLVPQVLLMGGATLLNLGLLSSDGWAALARQLWFGGFQGWSAVFFVASLLLVAAGLLVFTLSGSPKPATHGGDSGQSGGCAEPTAAAAAAAGNGVVYARLQSAECDVQQQAGGSHAQQQQQLPTDKQSAV